LIPFAFGFLCLDGLVLFCRVLNPRTLQRVRPFLRFPPFHTLLGTPWLFQLDLITRIPVWSNSAFAPELPIISVLSLVFLRLIRYQNPINSSGNMCVSPAPKVVSLYGASVQPPPPPPPCVLPLYLSVNLLISAGVYDRVDCSPAPSPFPGFFSPIPAPDGTARMCFALLARFSMLSLVALRLAQSPRSSSEKSFRVSLASSICRALRAGAAESYESRP